jgi:hypothetical protein
LLRRRAALDETVALSTEAGSGESGAIVFEVEDLLVPAGTDWSTDGHVLGTVDVEAGQFVIGTFYLELEALPQSDDEIGLAEWPTPGEAYNSNDFGVSLSAANDSPVVRLWKTGNLVPATNMLLGGADDQSSPGSAGSVTVGLYSAGPTSEDITVVRARASFLLL